MLNDAVAIVLARTLLSFKHDALDASAVLKATGVFISIFVGSMLIGIVAGVFSSLTYKVLKLKHQHEPKQVIETALAFAFPWAAYYTSEALELSGIVTIMFCGIVMASYARHSLSAAGRQLTEDFSQTAARIAETFVFVYLGMAAVAFPIFEHTVWVLAAVGMLACLLGRLHVPLVCVLTNAARKLNAKPRLMRRGHGMIIWFSGLRGGVAFAIASASYAGNDFGTACGGLANVTEDATHCAAGVEDGLAIMQVTLLIALFSIFVFGSASRDMAVACRVLDTPLTSSLSEESSVAAGAMADAAADLAPSTGRWHRFHTGYLKPALVLRDAPHSSDADGTATRDAPHADADGGDDGANGHGPLQKGKTPTAARFAHSRTGRKLERATRQAAGGGAELGAVYEDADAAAPQPEVADDEGAYGGMNEAALAAQRAEAEGNGSFKRSNGDQVYEL